MAKGLFSLRGWDGVSRELVLIGAILAGVLYFERAEGLFAPSPIPPVSVSAMQVPAKNADLREADPSRLDPGDDEDVEFDEILERPLFAKDRRPQATIASAPVVQLAAGLDKLKLAATVRDGDRRVALLQGATASEYYTVALGEKLRGWLLVEIEEGRALFEKDEAKKSKGAGGKQSGADRVILDHDGARPAKPGK